MKAVFAWSWDAATRWGVALWMARGRRFSCRVFGVEGSGVGGAHRPGLYGPTAARRRARKRRSVLSGQAEGSRMRIRAAPSTTRAAILIRRRRRVVNSATAQGE